MDEDLPGEGDVFCLPEDAYGLPAGLYAVGDIDAFVELRRVTIDEDGLPRLAWRHGRVTWDEFRAFVPVMQEV